MSGSAALICLLLISWSQHVSAKGEIRKFPAGFQFGAATAAYQVEGAWDEDGKGVSIWDVATHMDPSPIEDQSTGDIAADSYHHYNRDVEMAKELGLDFYRFSISWTRILPNGFPSKINQHGINYYNNIINKLLENGIEPLVTMYHWDLPENLQQLGGWTNPLIVTWFHDYAKVLFSKFGDRVKRWITINEPKQICYEGYGSDGKAPFLNATGVGEYICSKNVLLAHAKVYHLYDDTYRKLQNGTIGISISCTWYEPNTDTLDDDQAAFDARQFDWGQYAHPIFSKDGDYPQELKHNVAYKSAEQGFARSRLPELSTKEVAYIRGSSDFFGVNSYTTKMAYRDASLDGMYASPSYMDDMGVALVKDQSWTQAQSSWLQVLPCSQQLAGHPDDERARASPCHPRGPCSITRRTPSLGSGRRLTLRTHTLGKNYVALLKADSEFASNQAHKMVPWGFYKLLIDIKNQYDNPTVVITENGWSTGRGLLDDTRIQYHRSYLNMLLDAIDEGCDIQGYTAWSLMDNFEWKHGYKEKFGLYEVDFQSNDRTRTPRKSAFIYKEIIKARSLDPNYEPDKLPEIAPLTTSQET
ncbi:myrosinase 1-like isoform X1 [Cydia pomonella]|uniref:myrosinase 1-like isoform X1 n=1 Tax=Cydia pomonella TaxID=82600 RepID=UPI002ADDC65F|nr:myrosinase 1-like isoform X1 [Cydia pomonella]